MNDLPTWSIEQSKQLYGIDNWSAGYLGVNSKGNLTIRPEGPNGPEADLFEIIEMTRNRDIGLPLLLRFNGILEHRLRYLVKCFKDAISEYSYSGSYVPAYPIKVNQQKEVVEVLRNAGKEFSLGLEVGSKPELLAVLAIHDGLVLCNGYKDKDYIQFALMAQKIGKNPILIIEKLSELPLIIQCAREVGVKPRLAIRLRLTGRGIGRWEKSGGDKAKFGLTISEVVRATNFLEEENMLDCLELLHFHIGSQLTAINPLRNALKEACYVYAKLKPRCNNLNFMDIGGGLAVDYDGSRTNFESSMNYSVEEYARDVVWTIKEICEKENLPCPNIVTEAGRAMSAYSSILVFNILGIANTFRREANVENIKSQSSDRSILNLADLLEDVTPKNCHETYNDAIALRQECIQKFNMGLLSIEDRALAEDCFWSLLNLISKLSAKLNYVPEDLENLPAFLTDTYFCNLSVFRSLPDSWAINQIFPIAPLHRLDEKPTNRVVLGDITCDSDGKIERFADLKDVSRYLPAHNLKEGKPYYFATFLVGAYQEILGDLHNLFGATNAVHVDVERDGKIKFSNVVMGDTVREVLHLVQYEKEQLLEQWRLSVESAVNEGKIEPSEVGGIINQYGRAFEAYTYLSS